MDENAQA
jgi:hypothetical protein